MSKAFTRESEQADAPIVPRPVATLPPGAKNYLTPDGAKKLREELEDLIENGRPSLLALGADGDAKRRLHILDQRIRHLEQSLQTAVVAVPPELPWEQVRFGATVTVRERSGEQTEYRIVGADEMDIDKNWVSWLSPIAKALLNAKLGQKVRFKFPSGEAELEIVKITYGHA